MDVTSSLPSEEISAPSSELVVVAPKHRNRAQSSANLSQNTNGSQISPNFARLVPTVVSPSPRSTSPRSRSATLEHAQPTEGLPRKVSAPSGRSSSANVVTESLTQRLPLIYSGLRPCTLIEQCVERGSAVSVGSQLAVLSLATQGGYDASQLEDEAASADASGDEEGGGGGYKQEDDSNSSVSEEMCHAVVWEGADGVLDEWMVDVDAAVQPGDTLAWIRASERLAHLIKADEFARRLRNERMDWGSGINARFQTLTEKLVRAIACGSRDVVQSSDTLATCYNLERVARDFMDTARTYGKVIISEVHLPSEAKTVRPTRMGGMLGGSKYVLRDVLFKLGNGDVFAEYPDPLHIANKIQGHELKGLRAYFGYFFNKGLMGLVSFPLTALIDFKGHRITAMTELPIAGAETLIFGSMNAGSECNVVSKDDVFTANVNAASLSLGLKPHHVTNGRSEGGETKITCCVDLEGHQGKDGKKYLLDFSRTFPPAFKALEEGSKDRLWPFYHMFRGEFLLHYKKTALLSADAYSNFQSPQRPDEKAHNHAEVRAATDYLKSTIVHNVCVALADSVKLGDPRQRAMSLSHIFHREGLNMRYLGLVYAKLAQSFYSEAMKGVLKDLFAEALSRVLKNYIRGRWRREDGESNQLDATRDVLNAFFGRARNENEWCQRNPYVRDGLIQHFSFTASFASMAVRELIRPASNVDRATVSLKFVALRRLSESTGLEIDSEVMQDLSLYGGSMRGRSFDNDTVFDGLDFSFTERVKQLDIVQRAFGLSQYLKGVQLMAENNPLSAEQFLLRGFFIVEKVLEASPLDPWLTALMGDMSCGLWLILSQECEHREAEMRAAGEVSAEQETFLSEQREVCTIFKLRAEKYYQEAVLANAVVAVKRNYGIYLLRCGRLEEAKALLSSALEDCSNDGGTLNGQLVSEWELAAELTDLLKECHDMQRAESRPKEQLAPVPVAEAKKKHHSVVSKLGISLRKFKAEDRSAAQEKKSLRKVNGAVSPTMAPASTVASANPTMRKSSRGNTVSSVGSSAPNLRESSGRRESMTLRLGGERPLTRSESHEQQLAGLLLDDRAEELRLSNERHKLLLSRLRGK